jgi:hypothetical protein
MAVTHTWSVGDNLTVEDTGGQTDVVNRANWKLRSPETVDGVEYECTSGGTSYFDVSDLSNFTAFADLTEAQVLQWVQDGLNNSESGGTVQQWEDGNARNIAKQQNPPTRDENAPWA